MELADIDVSEDVHWSLWLRMIPDSLKTLQQQLGRAEKGTYMEVYDALRSIYEQSLIDQPIKTKKRKNQNQDDSTQQLNIANDHQPSSNKKFNQSRRRQRGSNKNHTPNPNRWCAYCQNNSHWESQCRELKQDTKNASNAINNKRTKTHKSLDHVDSLDCFIELPAKESDVDELVLQLAYEVDSTIFIFDSGATTHVTGSDELLEEVRDVPETTVNTAIKGAYATVRARGTVHLNDEWCIQDVAYAQPLLKRGGKRCVKNSLV